MNDDEYMALVERAKSRLPEDIARHERFQVPEPDVFIEGKNTVLRNFGDIVDALNRKPEDVFQYLQRELGTSGLLQGRRIIFKGKLTSQQIGARIKSYVENYVLCSECGRPDTRIEKEGRTLILACDACGARRPIKVKKGILLREKEERIKEGEIYELMIQDVGSRGDGVARRGDYIIYVPGTAKGTIVKVRIEKVSGTRAFGKVVRE